MGIGIIHSFKSVKLELVEKARYRPTDQFPVLLTKFVHARRALLKPRKDVRIGKQNESGNSTHLAQAYKEQRLAEGLIDRGYCRILLLLVKK
jgi:hypothetical protein